MSILQKKLVDIYRNAGPEIGFRRTSDQQKKRQMLVLADVSGRTSKQIEDIASSGIDAVFADTHTLENGGFAADATTINKAPLGISITHEGPGKPDKIDALQYDYIVFDPDTPVELVEKEKTARILRVGADIAPHLIRVINNLSIAVDAVLITDESKKVSFNQLLTCQLFADLLHKPVIVTVSAEVTGKQLSYLHEAGARGVMLGGEIPAKTCAKIVEMIDSLPPVSRKKKVSEALLPSLNQTRDIEEEEEEEDFE